MIDPKEMKDSEQIQVEIEFWEGVVGGKDTHQGLGPLCHEFVFCAACPLERYLGGPCDQGLPYHEWCHNKTPETAQAMVDRLKEIRYRLFRLDR